MDDDVRIARLDVERYGIPKRDYVAWVEQRRAALAHGIPFRFGLLAWRLWWMSELRHRGEGACRGKRRGMFRMSRIDKSGAYEPGNVVCAEVMPKPKPLPATVSPRSAMMREWHRTHECYLRGRAGEAHPRAKPVIDHDGVRWGSLTLAISAHKTTWPVARRRLRTGEWCHAPMPEKPPGAARRPRKVPVRTPDGEFASMAEAAQAHGVTKSRVYQLVREGRPGWEIVE